jgi:AcrR family transcriptional regulator
MIPKLQALVRSFTNAEHSKDSGQYCPPVSGNLTAPFPAVVEKRRRPDARVAIFWHIPWPNSEVFGICPWQHELLDGLLGADLIRFHIQAHCNNFLDTVDRSLESRIDGKRLAASLDRRYSEELARGLRAGLMVAEFLWKKKPVAACAV